MVHRIGLAIFAAALTMAACPADAGVVLSDNFDSENGPANSYTTFANWNVTSNTVDLDGAGRFQTTNDLLPGNGLYVHIDAGTLTSKKSFGPGLYTLTFGLGGSQQGVTTGVNVDLGSTVIKGFTVASGAGFTPLETLSLTITDVGGDTLSFVSQSALRSPSAFLDYVTLTYNGPVLAPEPASMALFGMGLVGIGAIRRRRA